MKLDHDYINFARNILEKQFLNELGYEDLSTSQIFSSKRSDDSFRYWSSNIGNIIIYREKILVRIEDKKALASVKKVLKNKDAPWLFEKRSMDELSNTLDKRKLKILNIAPFLIPNRKLSYKNKYDYQILGKEDIKKLETSKYNFVFSFEEGLYEDKLGLLYKEDEKVMIASGASRFSDQMWEISIEKYDKQKKGLALDTLKYITSLIQEKGILSIYGCQFSHIKSLNLAIRAGYEIAWVELMIGKIN